MRYRTVDFSKQLEGAEWPPQGGQQGFQELRTLVSSAGLSATQWNGRAAVASDGGLEEAFSAPFSKERAATSAPAPKIARAAFLGSYRIGKRMPIGEGPVADQHVEARLLRYSAHTYAAARARWRLLVA